MWNAYEFQIPPSKFLIALTLLSPVSRQSAPVQIESSRNLVRPRVGVGHALPQLAAQGLRVPRLAILVAALERERRLREPADEIQMLDHLGEMRARRRVRTEMRDEERLGAPGADAREAVAPDLEVDVGRRRRRQHEAPRLAADAG